MFSSFLLQSKLETAQTTAATSGKQAIAKVEERIKLITAELQMETTKHSDAVKNVRKCERRIKELTFQSEEDKKNQDRMQELVDNLQIKIKTYKRQVEEAEEVAALNLAKFRKVQQEQECIKEEHVSIVNQSYLHKIEFYLF